MTSLLTSGDLPFLPPFVGAYLFDPIFAHHVVQISHRRGTHEHFQSSI